MGHLLDKPKTEKSTEFQRVEGEPQELQFAASSMQGWRVEMEDAHCIRLNFDAELRGHHFVGVFDGHGGSRTSEWMSENLLQCIIDTVQFQEYKASVLSGTPRWDILEEALQRGFIEADATFKPILDAENPHDTSGSTAVCCLFTPQYIFCANAGDSRAVMAVAADANTDENFKALSEDHKPENPGERERIENAGGHVSMKRVDGDLAVSRSFGDFKFKQTESVGPEEQRVTALPDIVRRERKETDEWLLLACDGIWDVMQSDEGVDYIRHLVHNLGESRLELVAEEVLDRCLELNSQDNMTALVVMFPAGHATLGNGDGVRGLRAQRQQAEQQKHEMEMGSGLHGDPRAEEGGTNGRRTIIPVNPMDTDGESPGTDEFH